MHWSLAAAAFAWFSAKPVYGWGDEGHEMVGAIAQIHLLPSAQQAVCNILPPSEACSLAKISGWADDAKNMARWKWTKEYHFVNAVDDFPPSQCIFGDRGWTSPGNVLEGIVNATRGVKALRGDERDFALRFLVHYLGDAHQPMHLTARDVGGNQMFVKFNGKKENLHWVWDGLLLQQNIKILTNYTTRLPTGPSLPPDTLELNRRIETALRGSKYDPLVRWIVVEGIHGWWQSDIEDWSFCPQLLESTQPGQSVLMSRADPPFKDPVGLPVCPYHWSVATHQLGCDFAWRSNFVSKPPPRDSNLIEVNEPGYAGRAWQEKIIEKQLALGGIRLAAVLNHLLGSEEEKVKYGNVQLSF